MQQPSLPHGRLQRERQVVYGPQPNGRCRASQQLRQMGARLGENLVEWYEQGLLQCMVRPPRQRRRRTSQGLSTGDPGALRLLAPPQTPPLRISLLKQSQYQPFEPNSQEEYQQLMTQLLAFRRPQNQASCEPTRRPHP